MSKVYLMGVGPGDEELMTLKSVRVLKECTAVLYDRLAGGNILKHINKDCKVFYVGKESGAHYKTQEEINDLIIQLAKEGHIVGRVKGGDPYVFGRGGEEALRLIEENIDFEVVPGITSAIAVLNYAGIPITHRGMAQSFHVFTGMSAKNLNINWESVAALEGTLVFLMGLGSLDEIIENLVVRGKDKSTACGVIMRGTTSKQKKVVGDLTDISDKVKKAGLKSPCIIVIGDVVQLHEQLNWKEKQPLFGLNVCVTRTKEQAKPVTEKLISLGAEVTEINSIKIENTPENLKDYIKELENYNHIVFTSVNGVNSFFDYLKNINYDIRKIKAKISSIGPATTDSIKNRGIIPEIQAKNFVAESLFESLKTEVNSGEKILIPRAKIARPYLVEELRKLDCIVDEVHVYDTVTGDLVNKRAFEDVDVVLYTSPSTVRNMIKMVGLEELKMKKSLAIGPITNKELQINGMEAVVCEEYSSQGLIEKLLEIKEEA
ncbi:uroporphyrinogen-III C-methyltransferase [Clostridium grantii]|uniref:uroporphyrinogen-III C-methyltransferase n=1 Tax=Clostridium grantii DSM 8605 TaxID=1121316 RepID=A0A1M5V4X3_9CLOT|nr:uroporphyrinogen-III C-methyltransferase [Clostridium grantii]SHH70230.1 uroporphyrinogen III methyltransferase / synthase [Clostridium grantii DSM 8605]